ncbi:proprotein convertase subtilisin/kexin type 7-like [Babylonia areolata]|uniref:proprotein convertase subtilisin/kexin type 7-like n=1 Tax=Babylonia areolata TaxID=304850 RepID=UPI003FD03110
MVAMGTCRGGYCWCLMLAVLASCSQLIPGAPAYTPRPRREPACTHTTHATLCWTVQLKSPLHFRLTPASAETSFSRDGVGKVPDDRTALFDPHHHGLMETDPVHVSTNQSHPVHMSTNQSHSVHVSTNQSHSVHVSTNHSPLFPQDDGTSSQSSGSELTSSSVSAGQPEPHQDSLASENIQKNISVIQPQTKLFHNPSSVPRSAHHESFNKEDSLSEKTLGDASHSNRPRTADAYMEIPRHQKEYVYHQMALLLADEVGLSLLGKVGELYDHFVLCYEEEKEETELRNRPSGPQGFRESGKAFQLYHQAHSILKKSNAVTFEEVRSGAEAALHQHHDVAWFTMETVHRRQKRSMVFNDPAFRNQWHLVNHVETGMDINVTGVWQRGVTGKGVTVAVVDDGLEWDNPDLHDNYNFMGSWDLNDNDPDPMPNGDKVSNHHGTRCAGEIAAVANNKVCGVGVAHEAKVSGIRVLDGPMTDSLEAEAFNKKFDINAIYSCSWGPDDDGKTVDGPHILAAKAMKYGIEFGRHGYGSIFVVASGNGGSKQDNCNYDGYANSIYTVTIGAVDESGAMPYYAEECASMLGVTFSSGTASKRDIVTTDWRQKGSTGCTDRHTGTSASAPLAAGMIALMLEAQPCLTWRDVQYIIIITSVKIDRDLAHWQQNGAGLEHSHKHGFGLISAWRMVNAARVWRSVPWMTSYSEEETGSWDVPHGSHLPLIVTRTVTLKDISGYSLYMLEYVQVTLTLTHPFRGKLAIHLLCPSGTRSEIGAPRPHDNATEGFKDWTFTTVRCWGEPPTGQWTLVINDTLPADSPLPMGHLSKWRLTLFGTPMTTDEFQKRRMEVERAMSGEYLGANFTPPCDPPPVTTPPYIPLSQKTLKILFLASVFCVVFALYETMEYMLCYGEEKRQQAQETQQARSFQRANSDPTSPETARLLTDNSNDRDTDWLRLSQSAFEEDEDDDMFLLDSGIATQMRQGRGLGRRGGPSSARGERIPLSSLRTPPRPPSASEKQEDTGTLSEASRPTAADGGSGAAQTVPDLTNGVEFGASGWDEGHQLHSAASGSRPVGSPDQETFPKNSILPEMWSVLTRGGESDSDSQDELFSRGSGSTVALLGSDGKKPHR